MNKMWEKFDKWKKSLDTCKPKKEWHIVTGLHTCDMICRLNEALLQDIDLFLDKRMFTPPKPIPSVGIHIGMFPIAEVRLAFTFSMSLFSRGFEITELVPGQDQKEKLLWEDFQTKVRELLVSKPPIGEHYLYPPNPDKLKPHKGAPGLLRNISSHGQILYNDTDEDMEVPLFGQLIRLPPYYCLVWNKDKEHVLNFARVIQPAILNSLVFIALTGMREAILLNQSDK